jgi:hypothetical protein
LWQYLEYPKEDKTFRRKSLSLFMAFTNCPGLQLFTSLRNVVRPVVRLSNIGGGCDREICWCIEKTIFGQVQLIKKNTKNA